MLQSRRRRASESKTVYPVHSKSNKQSIFPDIIYSALKNISQLSQACPFPPVVLAAQLAVDIWDKVMEIRQNKAEFRNLAYTAGDTVKIVWDEIDSQIVKSGMRISDSFTQSVDDLSRVVSSIHELVCDYAGRGFFRRFFCSNKDLGYIAEFQQELDQARRNFELGTMVSVRATVERIEQNQHHPGGSSPTQGPFANMTVNNTGGGVFNNVVGNQYNGFATSITGGRNWQTALKVASYDTNPRANSDSTDRHRRSEVMQAKAQAKRARYDRMHRQVGIP